MSPTVLAEPRAEVHPEVHAEARPELHPEQQAAPEARSAPPSTDVATDDTRSSGAIREGSRVPSLTLHVFRDEHWQQQHSDEIFKDRTVVVFALPGAFTPTCSSQHLPRYNELAPELFTHGVQEILCVSVNDHFVMQEWGQQQGVGNVTLVADGNGEFTQSVGMLIEQRAKGLGMRSRRYSMLVKDGVIEKLFVEPEIDPEKAATDDPYGASSADSMLDAIAPGAHRPDRVLLLSREGCPYCAQARELLERAGFEYVDLPLGHAVRARIVGAITGRDTVPQVFINGRWIGGLEDLQRMVDGPSGPPEQRPT